MLPLVWLKIKSAPVRWRYIRNLLLLSAATISVRFVVISRPSFLGSSYTDAKDQRSGRMEEAASFADRRMNLTVEQWERMSPLGRWLFSPEGSPPPTATNNRSEPYTILVWENGPFLERRHLRRFSTRTFSPWDSCSVNNCRLSYDEGDLKKADAVLFHLHRTKNVRLLPPRTSATQRWVFLTDESPFHTFLNAKQNLLEYNGLFNWSMTYRMDSDVPVPYGRAVLTKDTPDPKTLFRITGKSRLVAIMGSNCGGVNRRWNYVRRLKDHLGKDLDVYGRCLKGNTTACPGHFDRDCSHLSAYKFYLAFENSNCREYLTEKTFWNSYEKLAVPVIMGTLRKDCDRLLPPHSFIHVQDYASPSDLASYLRYLDRNNDEYMRYHEWRSYYKVINEHGYFQSPSRHYCRLCEALNYNPTSVKIYRDLENFWSVEKDCTS